MTELDLSEFKKRLLQHQEELLGVEASGEQASEVVELDQTSVGRLSRMDAMQAQAMSVETNHRRKQELRRIKRALVQIEDGDYGYCQDCGEMINPQRLKSSLTATLCIECANKAETNI
jgi:DnaK suppressor protein